MREPTARVVRRIVVGIDASSASVEALTAAARLAASRRAELIGIYVEDDRLIRVAALPVAREVCVASGSGRALGASEMARALRIVAARARRAVEAAAARAQVPWRFEVARGGVAQELLRAAHEAELVVLGRASRAAGRLHVGTTAHAVLHGSARPVLLLRRPLGAGGAVIVSLPAAGESDAALRAAVGWARALEGRLVVVASGDRDADQIEQALAAAGHTGRVYRREADVAGVEALIDAVRAERASLLVLDMTRNERDQSELQNLLRRTDVSLLFVR